MSDDRIPENPVPRRSSIPPLLKQWSGIAAIAAVLGGGSGMLGSAMISESEADRRAKTQVSLARTEKDIAALQKSVEGLREEHRILDRLGSIEQHVRELARGTTAEGKRRRGRVPR